METPTQALTQFITEEEYEQMYGELERSSASLGSIQRLPRSKFERAKILDAFGEAFELIGGVPRLALWAHENPSKFFAHLAKLGNSPAVEINSRGPLVIRPALPPSSLDE